MRLGPKQILSGLEVVAEAMVNVRAPHQRPQSSVIDGRGLQEVIVEVEGAAHVSVLLEKFSGLQQKSRRKGGEGSVGRLANETPGKLVLPALQIGVEKTHRMESDFGGIVSFAGHVVRVAAGGGGPRISRGEPGGWPARPRPGAPPPRPRPR